MCKSRLDKFCFLLFLVVFGLMATPGMSAARETSENLPARSLKMAVEYPGIAISGDEEVSMDIIFYNEGRSNENVEVQLAEIPMGWEASIKTYRFDVSRVHVPSDDQKTLTFEAVPDENLQPGQYEFMIKARTVDGKFEMDQSVLVEYSKASGDAKKEKGVRLTTSYPVIRGPSDATFEFSMEVDSKLEEDSIFDLFAQGPTGWEINFKPAYESKFITSLRLKSNESKTVAVEVKPAMGAEAGEYPIDVRVSSGNAKGEVKLRVVLTGTYGLEVGTASGLLSLEARQGKPSNVSFYVKNTGSAVNTDIKFMSFKPENWKVEFTPESIDAIEPGDFKQVEMTITPYEDALVGDYSVAVNIEGEKVSKSLEFRTTVKASAAWGWIGIAIIILVIGGLFGIFRWLGRR